MKSHLNDNNNHDKQASTTKYDGSSRQVHENIESQLIKMAYFEDLQTTGDVTTDAIFDEQRDTYQLVAKQDGILCGSTLFTRSFHYIDKTCQITFHFKDGDVLKNGQVVADVKGPIRSLLKSERTALNFISHLSGVSTQTKAYVDAAVVSGKAKILDTRKTLPGWRILQKYAVKCGGGSNHRIGLYDMVLIKDNHIDGAGGIIQAVEKVRMRWKDRFRIEVETRDLDEVKEALHAGADIIMLDNMDSHEIKKTIKFIGGRAEVEASGNMTLERISRVSATGVDFISVGALTHSVPVFDFSFKKEKSNIDD